MYDTGLGAIAYSGGSLLQKLRSRRVLRPLAAFTVLKPKSTVTQFFKPKVVVPKSAISTAPLPIPFTSPLSLPSISLSATGGAGATGGTGGTTASPDEDTTEFDTSKLRGALSMSPLVIVGVGALALFMLSKKGR
jgi:hypothetical protein